MTTIAIPVLFAVLGALVYGFSTNAKVGELGRITYFVGFLWTVYMLGRATFHF